MRHYMLFVLLFSLSFSTVAAGVNAEDCVATTNIPELKEGIARTCGPHVKSVSIEGDHQRVRYTITFTKKYGTFVLGGPMSIGAMQTAYQSWHIFRTIYRTKKFEYAMRLAGREGVL